MREVNMLYECASTDHMPSIACVSCAEGSYGEMGSMLGSCVYEADRAILVCTTHHIGTAQQLFSWGLVYDVDYGKT